MTKNCLNYNDENSIDADELLLALTEEWGDKDAAFKRKEALEIQRQEKIKEAQEKQMKSILKNLSLARGALLSIKSAKQSKDYQKRMGQITSLEASLKNNPYFLKHDLLENHEPYLYDNSSGSIYRKNDVVITQNGTYLVETFNFKKQELLCTELENESERKDRIAKERIQNGKGQTIVNKYISLSELNGKQYGYSRNVLLYHLEKSSKDLQEILKNIKSEDFYKYPESEKEKY
jgi:hypothetical protein